jgi:hypothetical protein
MTKKDERTKPKYESPTVVALGGLAQGIGNCADGSNPANSSCDSGFSAYSSCGAGGSAGSTCDSTGASAVTACNTYGSIAAS